VVVFHNLLVLLTGFIPRFPPVSPQTMFCRDSLSCLDVSSLVMSSLDVSL
jgi:hypothetical protein